MQTDTATMENSMEIHLKKTSNKTIIKPTTPLLGIYPQETIIDKDTCTPIFIAALFTRARTWKEPRHSPTDEWIKQLCYIYTTEYCA